MSSTDKVKLESLVLPCLVPKFSARVCIISEVLFPLNKAFQYPPFKSWYNPLRAGQFPLSIDSNSSGL